MKRVNYVRDSLGAEVVQLPRRRSLAEDAAEKLRELILLEKLPPGTPVPERDLADEFGISRTPLKQALRTLELEGLVEYGPTRRPKVANPSLEEIGKNIAVLGALEALAGETACRMALDEEVDEILQLNDSMQRMPHDAPSLEFFDLDMLFHEKIVRAARNEPLADTHRQYNARLWRARFLSSRQTDRRDNTLAEHQAISRALADRNAAMISMSLRRHLESTVQNINRLQADRNHEDHSND